MTVRQVFFYQLWATIVFVKSQGTFKTTTTGPKPIWNDTHLDKLKKDLLLNYDRYVRPENYENHTNIHMSLTVMRLETDEARSVVDIDAWIGLDWSDSKLKWTEEDYGGINVIRIADHEVWQPDIYLYNSASDGEQLTRVASKNVLIYPNGQVLWVPTIKLTAFCEFNLRYWPFDRQYCLLKFTSWTLTSSELKYSNVTSLTIEDTASASAWHIEGDGELVSDWYPCCRYSQDKVVYHLNLTRKSTPYYALAVAPAVVSTFLILSQFALPPYVEEKIILNVFIVTLLNIFLFYFNKQVYASGPRTPLIVLFYSYSLYLAGIALFECVVTYLLSTVPKSHPPSRCVKNALGCLQKWLFLTSDEKTDDWSPFYQLWVVTVFVSSQRIITGPKPIWNDTYLDILKKDLLLNYDRHVRPENYENYTEVRMFLVVMQLEIDEARSVVDIDAWLTLQAKVEQKDYGGVKEISIGNHEIWKPDIYLYNSVSDGEQLTTVASKNVMINSNGLVLWVPSIKLTALCEFNLRHWPFDRQYCPLKFMSWTLTSSELKYSDIISLTIEDTTLASSWDIEGVGEIVSDWYPCCWYSQDMVVYHLNLTRKSTPYSALAVAPAVVSTFLILSQFALPPYVEEKIILNVFIVTLLNIFLFYFNKQVYASGPRAPLIGQFRKPRSKLKISFPVLFYSYCLYLAGISFVASVITYLMSTVRKPHPLPRCIKRALVCLQKWLFLDTHETTDDWVIMTACINKTLLLVYMLIFLVSAIVLNVIS
ncbi:hypothetical protein FQR65_LT05046 [Abscondita terminalis]|nr:hypothetical protein FQR65_LT05046 [Abscondita terminalis]